MRERTIVGVFDDVSAAEKARAQLTESGISANRIVLSANLVEDGIAAEAPGQSYEHQSYRGSDKATGFGWLRSLLGRKASSDTERARYNEAVRTGACLLSVSSESGQDRKQIEELMHGKGARITMERPIP